MADRIDGLAYGDRYAGRLPQQDMTVQVFRRQWLLEPGEIERFVVARPPDGFGNREALIRVHHQFHIVANRLAHRPKALHVFAHVWFTDFYFHALKTARLVGQRVVDDLRSRKMQPAAFGIVDGYFPLCSARHHVQRQTGFPAAHVPQRRIDGTKRQAGNRPDGRRVRMEEQILPDLFDHRSIAPEQLRAKVVANQGDDRRTSRAYGIGVAGALGAVIGIQAHHWRFLRMEGLDCIAALHMRLQVDLEYFDPNDLGHAATSVLFPATELNSNRASPVRLPGATCTLLCERHRSSSAPLHAPHRARRRVRCRSSDRQTTRIREVCALMRPAHRSGCTRRRASSGPAFYSGWRRTCPRRYDRGQGQPLPESHTADRWLRTSLPRTTYRGCCGCAG